MVRCACPPRCLFVSVSNLCRQYDIHKDPHKNIALPDSLLSRFDLLFVVTDDVNEERDRRIAEHVLRMHRYLPPGVEEGTPVTDSLTQSLAIDGPNAAQADADEGEPSPFEKYDPLIHFGIGGDTAAGKRRMTTRGAAKKAEVLSIAFVKKYIQYAKGKPPPVLTKEAADYIVQVYSNLRNENMDSKMRRVRALRSCRPSLT